MMRSPPAARAMGPIWLHLVRPRGGSQPASGAGRAAGSRMAVSRISRRDRRRLSHPPANGGRADPPEDPPPEANTGEPSMPIPLWWARAMLVASLLAPVSFGDEPNRPTASPTESNPAKPAEGHSVHGEAFNDGPRHA